MCWTAAYFRALASCFHARYIVSNPILLSFTLLPAGTLVATMFLLFHWAEQKRMMDFRNPGSQGDGSFFGITDDFKGKENGYPGNKRSSTSWVAYLQAATAVSMLLWH